MGRIGCGACRRAKRRPHPLIERINALGGAPVTMDVNPLMRYFTKDPSTGETRYLSRGIFEELVEEMRKAGAMRDNIFNPEWLKIILNRKMQEAGVELLFNSVAIAADREGDRLTSITVANKSGMVKLAASYFIDCTGDADVGGRRISVSPGPSGGSSLPADDVEFFHRGCGSRPV